MQKEEAGNILRRDAMYQTTTIKVFLLQMKCNKPTPNITPGGGICPVDVGCRVTHYMYILYAAVADLFKAKNLHLFKTALEFFQYE
jgi:hypothetical protein